jgi:hypothetical protein
MEMKYLFRYLEKATMGIVAMQSAECRMNKRQISSQRKFNMTNFHYEKREREGERFSLKYECKCNESDKRLEWKISPNFAY